MSKRRKTAYADGLRTVQEYLHSWVTNGLFLAGHDFLVGDEQSRSQSPGTPQLTSWKILGYCQTSWTSSSNFTLSLEMDMHFAGDAGAWGEGRNDRFVTFTRSKGSTSDYRLRFATSR